MKLFVALIVSALSTSAFAVNIQPTGSTPVCLQRTYTQAELAASPDQKLSELTVKVELQINKDGDGEVYRSNVAKVVGRSTANDALYGNTAGCEYSGGSARCSIDCDGGAFNLSTKNTWARFAVATDYYFPLYKNDMEADLDKIDQEGYELPLQYEDPANNLYRLEEVPVDRCDDAISKVKQFDGGC